MNDIQLFVPTFHIEECLEEIRMCLEKGWTGFGYKTVEFETAWKDYTDLKYAHFVGSATAGLHLAVKILKDKYNWKPGDQIISTGLTFVSTNHAIKYEGLVPVFADVDEYLCLDPLEVESKINHRTRAVMFVGLGGNVGRLKEIEELCKKYNLKLILDAAHMSGTRWADNNEHVGKEADVTVFSFQAVKNLPTADSGMICFKNKEFDELVRKLSWVGIDKDTYTRTLSNERYKWYYDVIDIGYKYHGNSIMAAIGLVELKYLEKGNEVRRAISDIYNDKFKDNPNIKLVPTNKDCISSRHLYQIMINDRDKFITKLNDVGIFPGVHYRDNSLYKMYSYNTLCPLTRLASDKLVSLPLHLRLTLDDILYITKKVNELA